jgi:hypothetical protein
LKTEPERPFFRIVIGCYSRSAAHWSAREDLRSNGLGSHQICSLGSRSALALDANGGMPSTCSEKVGGSAVQYQSRRIRELEIHISSPGLFDSLWPGPYDQDGSLTRWMTATQSDTVWRKLCDDCPLLMVSADSEQQQVRSVQIQLKHGPTIVQAFNFAAGW